MQHNHGEASGPAWRDDPLLVTSGVATQDYPASALYVVATPIGNVADITLRALWVLAQADAIAAEDTRVTRALLARYGIATPRHGVIATHAHNERGAGARINALLADGARVALVTDAGTPAISDPGARVVADARTAGHRVIPVPGASSVTAALCAAGFGEGGFRFIGFVPTGAKARQRVLADAAAAGETFVLLEAPHRVAVTVRDLHAALGATRRVLIARELTKLHETIEVVPAAELAAWCASHTPRGEYVIAVDADADTADAVATLDATTRRWLAALADALPAARAAAVAAKATGLPRELLYAALTARAQPANE